MPKDVEDQFSHIVVGAADRAQQFLGVVQQRCDEMQIGLQLEAFQRSARSGGGMALRGNLKYGQGIEVFAQPMGPSLQVGYQLTTHQAGGALAGIGLFGEINTRRAKMQSKTGNVREVAGMVQAFNQLVLGPVIQELTDAVAQQRGAPNRNGFLGA
jgi:hypothetical protein